MDVIVLDGPYLNCTLTPPDPGAVTATYTPPFGKYCVRVVPAPIEADDDVTGTNAVVAAIYKPHAVIFLGL